MVALQPLALVAELLVVDFVESGVQAFYGCGSLAILVDRLTEVSFQVNSLRNMLYLRC